MFLLQLYFDLDYKEHHDKGDSPQTLAYVRFNWWMYENADAWALSGEILIFKSQFERRRERGTELDFQQLPGDTNADAAGLGGWRSFTGVVEVGHAWLHKTGQRSCTQLLPRGYMILIKLMNTANLIGDLGT